MSSNALTRTLGACATLLKRANERFWGRRLEQLLEGDRELSSHDARELLSWFGGMGSFNDLVIAKENGHSVSGEQEAAFNEELNRLRSAIFEEARSMARNE